MNIRGRNIGILILGIIIAILLLRHGHAVSGVVDDLRRIGPSNSMDERFVGFMVWGLIGVCIVAIVKILTHHRPNDRRGRRDDPPED